MIFYLIRPSKFRVKCVVELLNPGGPPATLRLIADVQVYLGSAPIHMSEDDDEQFGFDEEDEPGQDEKTTEEPEDADAEAKKVVLAEYARLKKAKAPKTKVCVGFCLVHVC